MNQNSKLKKKENKAFIKKIGTLQIATGAKSKPEPLPSSPKGLKKGQTYTISCPDCGQATEAAYVGKVEGYLFRRSHRGSEDETSLSA